MLSLPALPGWTGLHPAISHFPIVLLLVVPVLVLLGLARTERRRSLFITASWLLIAGTLAVFVAAASGDASRDSSKRTPEIAKAIAAHEDLGGIARVAFSAMTVLMLGVLYGDRFTKRPLSARQTRVFGVIFLVLYTAAALVLVKTAHSGGLLVHKLGIHAPMP